MLKTLLLNVCIYAFLTLSSDLRAEINNQELINVIAAKKSSLQYLKATYRLSAQPSNELLKNIPQGFEPRQANSREITIWLKNLNDFIATTPPGNCKSLFLGDAYYTLCGDNSLSIDPSSTYAFTRVGAFPDIYMYYALAGKELVVLEDADEMLTFRAHDSNSGEEITVRVELPSFEIKELERAYKGIPVTRISVSSYTFLSNGLAIPQEVSIKVFQNGKLFHENIWTLAGGASILTPDEYLKLRDRFVPQSGYHVRDRTTETIKEYYVE